VTARREETHVSYDDVTVYMALHRLHRRDFAISTRRRRIHVRTFGRLQECKETRL
jgi:hypothetical protein